VIDVPGRGHPLEIAYAPGQSIADAATEVVGATDGQVLCFLPGAGEIRRAIADLQPRVGSDVEIVPLHGSLDAEAQDLALRPSPRRRIIVATNIAETSLTVPGVTAVIDTGVHKVARYDAERSIDSLETERITADAADQRAGRAGRIAPGVVRRLWDPRDRLRPHREPEIHRIDLASTALDVIAWGGDPRTFEWFEQPDEDAIAVALALLERLGLVEVVRNPQSAIRNVVHRASRISTVTCLPSRSAAVDASVRSAAAVRPCRPITFAMSCGDTNNSMSVICLCCDSTTRTSSGRSVSAFASTSTTARTPVSAFSALTSPRPPPGPQPAPASGDA
jgi:HrpA-like RNA helicase